MMYTTACYVVYDVNKQEHSVQISSNKSMSVFLNVVGLHSMQVILDFAIVNFWNNRDSMPNQEIDASTSFWKKM